MDNQKSSSGYDAVKKLAKDYPDWLVAVKEALEVLKIYPSGEFPGKRVLQNIREKRKVFFPNLKRLVKYGILERKGLSRGGKRAYYSMPDPEGVERAIKELMPNR